MRVVRGISLSIPLSPIARARAASPTNLPPSAPEVVSLSSRPPHSSAHLLSLEQSSGRQRASCSEAPGCRWLTWRHWPLLICTQPSLNAIYSVSVHVLKKYLWPVKEIYLCMYATFTAGKYLGANFLRCVWTPEYPVSGKQVRNSGHVSCQHHFHHCSRLQARAVHVTESEC